MVKLKSRTQAPPNGYLYTQKQTGWVSHLVDPITQWDFNRLCQSIRQHRLSNPQFKLSTDLGVIQEEVDTLNAARVAAIPGGDIYVTNTGDGAPPFTVASPTLHSLARVAEAARAGKDSTDDWIDSGTPPVAPEVSAKRAATCAVCPCNEKGGWERWFFAPMAAHIKRRIEKFHARKLTTPSDALIQTCNVCLCPLPTKVHEPIDLVLKHTTPDIKSELDPSCWILSEAL